MRNQLKLFWHNVLIESGRYADKPWLVQGQKVWIAVLTPLIVVALVVPLVAILFSGKKIIIYWI